MNVVVTKPNEADTRKEVRALKAASVKVMASKASARRFLIKNGFITAGNKLSKRYG